MRTTLDLEDDVLLALKNLAALQRRSLSRVVSELLRRALVPSAIATHRSGLEMLPVEPGSGPITPDLVERLLEDD